MNKEPHLQLAIQKGQWVSILAVPSGLACGCVCPACGGRLMAKKGVKQQHHFAHYREANCIGSLETALHQFAKTVIVAHSGLLVPPTMVYRDKCLRTAHWQTFVQVQEEVRLGNVQIDVLLQTGDKKLAVEIKVSHATNSYKQGQLLKAGIPAVEIDVMRIYQELSANDQASDLNLLQQAILKHPTYRTWLFDPLQHRYEYRLAKTATERKVVISKQGDYYHYLVYQCPKKMRFVRAGFREGQSFARVFQDCLHCECCRQVVYQQEWVGFKQINTLPKAVLCNMSST